MHTKHILILNKSTTTTTNDDTTRDAIHGTIENGLRINELRHRHSEISDSRNRIKSFVGVCVNKINHDWSCVDSCDGVVLDVRYGGVLC